MIKLLLVAEFEGASREEQAHDRLEIALDKIDMEQRHAVRIRRLTVGEYEEIVRQRTAPHPSTYLPPVNLPD